MLFKHSFSLVAFFFVQQRGTKRRVIGTLRWRGAGKVLQMHFVLHLPVVVFILYVLVLCILCRDTSEPLDLTCAALLGPSLGGSLASVSVR